MSRYQNAFIQIKKTLRDHPRGMTIQELSDEITINRNSLAKYLDVMLISGHVEMRPVGRAKMYYFADRIPLSGLLNLTSEYILVLNKELEIMQANDAFLDFFHTSQEVIIGKKIDDPTITRLNLQEILRKITNEGPKTPAATEISIKIDNIQHYLNVKFIPTTFEDGEQGTTLLIENITKRKHMDTLLKEREERYRSLFFYAPIGLGIASSDGFTIESNQALNRITGYSQEELQTTPISEMYVHPEKRKELLKILEEKSTVTNFQIKAKRKDGTIYDARLSVTKIPSRKNHILQTIVQDITEQKIFEKKILESEHKFKNFFENNPAYCYMISAEGRIGDINRSALKTLGYNKKEIIGKPAIQTIYAPSSQKKAKKLFDTWKKTGVLQNEELQIITKGGEERTVLLSANDIKNVIGKITFSISIQRDITKRKQFERNLYESEKRYRELIELIPTCIFETNLEGLITYMNPTGLQLFGYTQEDIKKGLKSIQTIIPEEKETLQKNKQKILKGEKVLGIKYTALRKDGTTFKAYVDATPIIQNNQIVGTRGITVNITK